MNWREFLMYANVVVGLVGVLTFQPLNILIACINFVVAYMLYKQA